MKTYTKYKIGTIPRRHWRGTFAASMALLVMGIGLTVSLGSLKNANAASDNTPPVLSSATITQGATIDTENPTIGGSYSESRTTIVANDDLSGNAAPIIVYTSPSGKQTATGSLLGADGNNYFMYTTFPQYSEAGVWKAVVYLEDNSGNKTTVSNALLHVMGSNIDVTLTGVGDTTDPTLTTITRSNPGTLDVTSYRPQAVFNVTLGDNRSGLAAPTVMFTSPSGNQSTSAATCDYGPSNTGTMGSFTCTVEFAQYSEVGVWKPSLILSDGAGNTVNLSDATLVARGINIRATIAGTSDVTAPTLTSAQITFANPPSDNIPYGGAVITISGEISDNLSGLQGETQVRYTSPTGHVVSAGLDSDQNGSFISNISLAQYTEGGTWTPSIYVKDAAGNSHTYTNTELVALGANLAVTVGKNITQSAVPGGTVTSDYEGDGATTSNPVEASVTTPSGGPVSIVIVQGDSIDDPTNGYTFFDRQISITAPAETVNAPLTLAFTIDASKIPLGETAATLLITRNGALVPPCIGSTAATPNPCVFSRQLLSGGDIQVKIHSTTASAWASGFPTHPPLDFKGFSKGTKDYPKDNKAQAGQVNDVHFKVKGVPKGVTNILADGSPTTQAVNCNTLNTIGSPEAALSGDNAGLDRKGNDYTYDWRTRKAWKNTCRILVFTFNDGSVQKALFDF